jgi:hypothetical protein
VDDSREHRPRRCCRQDIEQGAQRGGRFGPGLRAGCGLACGLPAKGRLPRGGGGPVSAASARRIFSDWPET